MTIAHYMGYRDFWSRFTGFVAFLAGVLVVGGFLWLAFWAYTQSVQETKAKHALIQVTDQANRMEVHQFSGIEFTVYEPIVLMQNYYLPVFSQGQLMLLPYTPPKEIDVGTGQSAPQPALEP